MALPEKAVLKKISSEGERRKRRRYTWHLAGQNKIALNLKR